MESRNTHGKQHPRANANIISKLIFWSEMHLVLKKWKREFTEEEIYATRTKYKSKQLGDRLEAAWGNEENFRKKPSLLRALFSLFGLEFLLYGLLYFPIHLITTLFQAYFLRQLLNYYSPGTSISLKEAYINASLLTGLIFLDTFTYSSFNLLFLNFGMKIRIACSSLLYRKCLKVKQKIQIGQIINLLSNDLKRFNQCFIYLHFIWIGPLECIVVVFYLEMALGSTALTGLIVLSFALILQFAISNRISSKRKAATLSTDKRMCLMDEIITKIESIKINCWETPFWKLIQEARNYELEELKKSNHLYMLATAFKFFLTELCAFSCIVASISSGFFLQSEYVFVLRSLYDSLKVSLVQNFPEAITHILELKITISRLQDFLLLDYQAKGGESIILKSASFFKSKPPVIRAYGLNYDRFKNLNFEAKLGEVIGITGSYSSGKSTLLKILLRNEVKERLEINGVISYSSQTPWLFPMSLKDNILFGEEFDDERFRKVIEIFQLDQEKQKSRIHLARAVYKKADFYLFDDPLADLDSKSAVEIYKKILEFLNNKCVLVATNFVPFLENTNKIFHLKNGCLLTIKKEQFHKFQDNWKYLNLQPRVEKIIETNLKPKETQIPTVRILRFYCQQAGNNLSLIIFIFLLVRTIIGIIDNFITFWVGLEEEPNEFVSLTVFFRTERCLAIYTILVSLLIFLVFFSTWVFLNFCTEASRKIHHSIFLKILYSRLEFFKNQKGEILNRFSTNLGIIDEAVPRNFKNTIELFLCMLASGVIISIANHYMIFPTVILFLIYIFYCGIFDKKSLTKLEATSQCRIYNQLATTIQDLPVICSSKVYKLLEEDFDNYQDFNTSILYISNCIDSSFNFWSDLTRSIYSGFAIFLFFFVPSFANNVGLLITQTMDLKVIHDFIKAWSDLDYEIFSLSKALEYSELTSESLNLCNLDRWSQKGMLQFKDLNLRNELASLITDDFLVYPGEKIGVLTNTPSGKFGLISVLLRLFTYSGCVLIDGVDIRSLPLTVLRSKIIVVLQKPAVFCGSLRQNLDPFEIFHDDEIWNALREVDLDKFVFNLSQKLNSVLEDNFSLKQLKLLCLAKVVLRKANIIVLDQSWYDGEDKTNRFIQILIKKKFSYCTVFTVASDLKSIMKSDKILVLNDGVVVMFCSPEKLREVSFHTFGK